MSSPVRFVTGSALLALATGCVTTDLAPEVPTIIDAQSVVIPLDGIGGTGKRDPLHEYYNSVLHLLQDAVLERNPTRLRELCNLHDRKSAPDWARMQIQRFRVMARVLDAELFVEERAALALRAEASPALGEVVPLRFEVPAVAPLGVRLQPGGTSRARFHLELDVTDYDCLGGRVTRSFSDILSPPESAELGADSIVVPFDVDAIAPEGVRRVLAVKVHWLPGGVEVDGETYPNRRVECVHREFELFPRGIEKVREQPWRTFVNALRSGETKHLDHVYLSTRFLPEERKRAAAEMLIARVRLGDRVQARACMAALAELTGAPISVDDRLGWLRWWSRQQQSR